MKIISKLWPPLQSFLKLKKLYFSNSRTLLHVSLCAWFANLPQAVRAFPPNCRWRVGPTPFIMQLSPGEMIINVSPNQAYLVNKYPSTHRWGPPCLVLSLCKWNLHFISLWSLEDHRGPPNYVFFLFLSCGGPKKLKMHNPILKILKINLRSQLKKRTDPIQTNWLPAYNDSHIKWETYLPKTI